MGLEKGMVKIRDIPRLVWMVIIFALLSIVLASFFRNCWYAYRDPWGYMLIGVWALGPPLWFLYEFVSEFPPNNNRPEQEQERLKQLHDLSRNIWLAFVVVLAAIMNIKWPVA